MWQFCIQSAIICVRALHKLAHQDSTSVDVVERRAAVKGHLATLAAGRRHTHTIDKAISVPAAQQVFSEMFETGKAPALIVQEKGLAQVSDSAAIEKMCDEAIAANPGPAADYRAGKVAALNFLKGQVMKLSKGKANPALAGEILERKLKA